jgi:protein NDRG1
MEEYEDEISKVTVKTVHCGEMIVCVQGTRANQDVIIITCHDLGCTYTEFTEFVKTSGMRQILKRFMWANIVVPGQGPNESDLPSNYEYPSLQELSEDVIAVMDHLNAKHCVIFGEGAGANILARFAMNHDDRVIGAVLIDLIGHSDNIITKTTRKISVTRKLSTQGMHQAAEEYLIHHRFGSMKSSHETETALQEGVTAFKAELRSTINPNNLNNYITAFMNRTSIKDKMGLVRCPVLLVTAQHAAQMHHVIDMHHSMQQALEEDHSRRDKVELLLIDNVSNVLVEAPEKLAESFQLFLQGLGLGSSIANRKISTVSSGSQGDPEKRIRSTSMADYDQPRGQGFYRKISSCAPPPEMAH